MNNLKEQFVVDKKGRRIGVVLNIAVYRASEGCLSVNLCAPATLNSLPKRCSRRGRTK